MAEDPDPQVQMLLDTMEQQHTPPTYGVTPAQAREQYEALGAMVESEDVGAIQDFEIAGPAGGIPVRTYHPPEADSPPILVYYHGGGHVIGSLDSHDNVCAALCNRSEAVVISVDYRLAPEHPFPAALEDAYAAARWATVHGEAIGGDPSRVAVGGDSAGGNLAAAVSLMADDTGEPDLTHQLLIYPAVASMAVHEFDSYDENAEGYLLERATMEWFHERYVQDPVDERNEYMAPLLARDLSGLPPATVVTAGFDPLRDEGMAYAERLESAGVDVRLENYEGMIHAFVQLTGMVDRADDALEMMGAELRDAFA